MKNTRRSCSRSCSRRVIRLLCAYVLLQSLLLSLLLSGCRSEDEALKKEVKIGIAAYDQYDNFISELIELIDEDYADIGKETGVTVYTEVYYGQGSQFSQNNQVKNMINHGCDVLCVNPVDRTDTSYIIDLAQENEIPVVFFNREPVSEDLLRSSGFYYVGADAVQSGVMEGELVADYCRDHPEADVNGDGIFQYILMEGEAGHQDAIIRTEYSINTIEGAGISLERVTSAIANWSGDQARAKMKSILESGTRPELIISNNDAMALGVMSAYEEMGIPNEEWPAIFGIDGIAQGLDAIEKGTMKATVYNDKEGQAEAITGLSYALATGASLDGFELENGTYIWLPYKKVTKDKVNEFRSQ
ncbi:MAG: galactose ABC transporter substrate-binding protein [Lachnospiraceae bacterium]|nr:galactose ABC transporter substrate-binding protein [Lachnospiraceae bacterium]